MYWQLSDISFDIHVLYFTVFFLMSMFVLAGKLLFFDSYYFLLVQLLNDLYQQSLFLCSCSKRVQSSAIKHHQGIKYINFISSIRTMTCCDFYVIYYYKIVYYLSIFPPQISAAFWLLLYLNYIACFNVHFHSSYMVSTI